MSATRYRVPTLTQQQLLSLVDVRLLGENDEDRLRFRNLMEAHHYLKSDHLVGEQLRYVAHADGQWVALLSWSAAAYHLKDREDWIGWEPAQRRRRLALTANNARFPILPGIDCPNLASRVLAQGTARLSTDWQYAYGHPIPAVESFVDSQLFRGTCYKAQGWQLLGATKGFERSRQDYYTEHARPKQLWVRELNPGARRTLAAAVLPDELQPVEDKVIPRSDVRTSELRGLWDLCRAVTDWRRRKGRDYPLPALLSITVLASLCGVMRGQRDLAAFAAGLTQPQLRALRCYRDRNGRYHYPKETTFQRVLANVDAALFERALQQWEEQLLGPSHGEGDAILAIDGKAQRGSTPHVGDEQKAQLVSAVSLPDGRVRGTVLVEQKSNEIPAARQLLENLGPLDGQLVMLDALHSNQETIRQIVQGNGADYLLPVKGNHSSLEARGAACLPDPPPAAASTPSPPPPGKKKDEGLAASASALGKGFSPLAPTLASARPAVRYRRH